MPGLRFDSHRYGKPDSSPSGSKPPDPPQKAARARPPPERKSASTVQTYAVACFHHPCSFSTTEKRRCSKRPTCLVRCDRIRPDSKQRTETRHHYKYRPAVLPGSDCVAVNSPRGVPRRRSKLTVGPSGGG